MGLEEEEIFTISSAIIKLTNLTSLDIDVSRNDIYESGIVALGEMLC